MQTIKTNINMHTDVSPNVTIDMLSTERAVLVIGDVNIFMNKENASELFAKIALVARDFDQQINEQGATQ